ncbi:putative SanE [Citreicella sp. SE45]|nr:putative SanE [Citreicella sp. SE45]
MIRDCGNRRTAGLASNCHSPGQGQPPFPETLATCLARGPRSGGMPANSARYAHTSRRARQSPATRVAYGHSPLCAAGLSATGSDVRPANPCRKVPDAALPPSGAGSGCQAGRSSCQMQGHRLLFTRGKPPTGPTGRALTSASKRPYLPSWRPLYATSDHERDGRHRSLASSRFGDGL